MNELYVYWSDWANTEIEEQFVEWIKENEFNWGINDGKIEINIQAIELSSLND